MKRLQWKMILALLGLCLVFGSGIHITEASQSSISIQKTSNWIRGRIAIPLAEWRRIRARGIHAWALAWVREPSGWSRVKRMRIHRHRTTISISKSTICGPSFNNKRMAIQLILRRRGLYLRTLAQSQRQRVSFSQAIFRISCGQTPFDYPRGTVSRVPAGQRVPSPPPTHRENDSVGDVFDQLGRSGGESGEHHGDRHRRPAFRQPAPVYRQPDPPTGENLRRPSWQRHPHYRRQRHRRRFRRSSFGPRAISSSTFASFRRHVCGKRFDSDKMTTIRSWVGRLRGAELRIEHIKQLVSCLRFDSTKSKAASFLSSYVHRPFRVSQLARLVSVFRFDSTKVKVALYYCRKVSNPLHMHKLQSIFRFSSSKQTISRKCR